jgi:hypothetical protein
VEPEIGFGVDACCFLQTQNATVTISGRFPGNERDIFAGALKKL